MIMQNNIVDFENSKEDSELDELEQFAGKLENERIGTQKRNGENHDIHEPAIVKNDAWNYLQMPMQQDDNSALGGQSFRKSGETSAHRAEYTDCY